MICVRHVYTEPQLLTVIQDGLTEVSGEPVPVKPYEALAGPNDIFHIQADAIGWASFAKAFAAVYGVKFFSRLAEKNADALMAHGPDAVKAFQTFMQSKLQNTIAALSMLRTYGSGMMNGADGIKPAVSLPYARNRRNAAMELDTSSRTRMLAQLEQFANQAEQVYGVLHDENLYGPGCGLKLALDTNDDGSARIAYSRNGLIALKCYYNLTADGSSRVPVMLEFTWT